MYEDMTFHTKKQLSPQFDKKNDFFLIGFESNQIKHLLV
jgi:hypothetical protein